MHSRLCDTYISVFEAKGNEGFERQSMAVMGLSGRAAADTARRHRSAISPRCCWNLLQGV